MWGEKPKSKAELLDYLARTYGEPQRFIALDAVQMPDDLPADLEGEVPTDAEGWSVDVQREHRFEPPLDVRLLIQPGLELKHVLATLDRLRAELVKRPELLSSDWEKPLRERPVLRVVKSPAGGT
jgi:hypothetical protein